MGAQVGVDLGIALVGLLVKGDDGPHFLHSRGTIGAIGLLGTLDEVGSGVLLLAPQILQLPHHRTGVGGILGHIGLVHGVAVGGLRQLGELSLGFVQPLPRVALIAETHGQRVLAVVAPVVDPLDGRHGVLAVRGDDEAVLRNARDVHRQVHQRGAVLALDGVDQVIVVILGVVLVQVEGGEHVARADAFLGAGLGVEGGVVLREAFGVHQALGIQHVEILQRLAEAFLLGGEDDLAILDHDVGGIIHNAEGAEEGADPGGAVSRIGGAEGQRDLVSLAILVGVLSLEGAQYFGELIDGGGDFQTQILQPGHVHAQHAGDLRGQALVDGGDAVDVAVGRGDQLLDVRALLQPMLQVDGVLLDQIVQRDQHAFLAVAGSVAHGQVAAVHHVRQVEGVQHQLNLLSPAGFRHFFPLDVDAGLFLVFLEQLHVGIAVGEVGGTRSHELQGQRLVHQRESDLTLREGGSRARQHKNDCEQGTHDAFEHGMTSFLFSALACAELRLLIPSPRPA